MGGVAWAIVDISVAVGTSFEATGVDEAAAAEKVLARRLLMDPAAVKNHETVINRRNESSNNMNYNTAYTTFPNSNNNSYWGEAKKSH